MDVLDAILKMGPWDIIILHLPCTAMAVAGNRFYAKTQTRINAENWSKNIWDLAKKFALVGCALENPVSTIWNKCGKPDYIQPYQFGHLEQKKTGILRHNLPKLKETNNVYEEMMQLPKKTREKVFYMSPSKNRSKFRSETYQGIADAMANQWGSL